MSEASQHQAIRRYWKKMYRRAQAGQQRNTQFVRTGVGSMRLTHESSVVEALRAAHEMDAWRNQEAASRYMGLLNKYKDKPAVR